MPISFDIGIASPEQAKKLGIKKMIVLCTIKFCYCTGTLSQTRLYPYP